MSRPEKKIRVHIEARETVRYDQYIEITQRDLDEYRAAVANPRYRGHADEILADWIDRRDVTDADDFECDDLEEVDEDGNVIRNLFDEDDCNSTTGDEDEDEEGDE